MGWLSFAGVSCTGQRRIWRNPRTSGSFCKGVALIRGSRGSTYSWKEAAPTSADTFVAPPLVLAVYIPDHDPGTRRRYDEPVLSTERTAGILEAGGPVLAHRGSGKFVILRVPLVRLLLVDQVEDGHFGLMLELLLPLALVIRQPRVGHLVERRFQPRLPCVEALEDIGVVAGARRVHDVLVPCHDVFHVARKRSARIEEVYLEHQRVQTVFLVEQVLQGCVRYDAAVPEIVAADLDHRQRRWQRTARQDVVRFYDFLTVVEVDEIAALDIDRSDREAHGLGIQQVEVDKIEKRLAQRRGIVVAGCMLRTGCAQPWSRHARREETRLSEHHREERTGRIARLAKRVAIRRMQPDLAGRYLVPERMQLFHSPLGRIPGDDRCIDRADRNAGHPVRLHAALV